MAPLHDYKYMLLSLPTNDGVSFHDFGIEDRTTGPNRLGSVQLKKCGIRVTIMDPVISTTRLLLAL